MLRNPDRLARFEAADSRKRYGDMTFAEALDLFEALWEEALELRPDLFQRDWRTDLEHDFAIARAINGLPPKP